MERRLSQKIIPSKVFFFSKETKPKIKNKINFKLPSLDLLEKNSLKINKTDNGKNRLNSEFMEKILLDFGIDGKIKKDK